MPIQCEIVTQDRMLYEGLADIVVVPGTEGEMGILPNHTPLLTTLDFGIVRVRSKDEEHLFAIAGGVMEVQPEIVNILADVGEDVEEIDEARALAARERAEALLKEGPAPDIDSYLAIEAALRRSQLRLEAVQRYRRAHSARPGASRPGEQEEGA